MSCCCHCCNMSNEKEDVRLVTSAFPSIDQDNDNNTIQGSNAKTEFDEIIESYHNCCTFKPKNQLKCYTRYNIITWIIVSIIIVVGAVHKDSILSKYAQDCCKCYYYAKDYSIKIDFGYCFDRDCGCSNCKSLGSNNDCSFSNSPVRWDTTQADQECNAVEDYLSISSFHVFRKEYWGYALMTSIYAVLYTIYMVCLIVCGC